MAYEFDMYDAISSHIKRLQENLFTALPATVVSYDASKQSVNVKVDIRQSNILTGEDNPEISLSDVPVIFPSGGGGILSFPIKAGNKVLVLFSSYSIDKWKENGAGVAGENRQHSLSDGIAIAGLFDFTSNLEPNPDDVELKAFGTTVTLKSSGDVEITPAGKTIINSDEDVNGNVQIDGNLDVTGYIKGNVVTDTATNNKLSTHTHPTSGAPPTAGT